MKKILVFIGVFLLRSGIVVVIRIVSNDDVWPGDDVFDEAYAGILLVGDRFVWVRAELFHTSSLPWDIIPSAIGQNNGNNAANRKTIEPTLMDITHKLAC